MEQASSTILKSYMATLVQTSKEPGFLRLPGELRELIYEHVLTKATNTVTMLDYFAFPKASDEDISARPPSICAVNRQLRMETLPLFYSINNFTAQLDNCEDLATTRAWLAAIGDDHIRHLKLLTLSGFTMVPFGHMVSRRWVAITLNLKDGKMDIKNRNGCTALELLQNSETASTVEEFQQTFQKLIDARDGKPFNLSSVGQLVTGFNLLCSGY